MPDLAEAAKALAERTLAYVAPPPRGKVNPLMDCDREMQRLAFRVLDALAALPDDKQVGTKPEGRSAPNQPGETSRG